MDKRVIISDLDGTLSDPSARLHLYKERKYAEFNKAGKNDKPIENVCNILRNLKDSETDIVICTARDESCRKDTEDWLKLNDVPYDILLMRWKDDQRHDIEVKRDMFNKLLEIYDFKQFWFVLEDRNVCVDMWRGEGLSCLQVAPGDY